MSNVRCVKNRNLMKCSHQTSANTLIVCLMALSHKYKNTKTAQNKIMCFHQTSAGSVVVRRTLLLTRIGHMSLLPSDSISEMCNVGQGETSWFSEDTIDSFKYF